MPNMPMKFNKRHISSIKKFYEEIPEGTESHRFKAWEYCYKYFKENRKKLQNSNELPNEALLVFSFYLASWGMYRGSSFLLSLDHTVHIEILKILLESDYDILMRDISELKTEGDIKNFISALMTARKKIVDFYEPIRNSTRKKQGDFNKKIRKKVKPKKPPATEISSILASKILLGIFGCIPAYDTFFKQGIKEVFQKGENGHYPISQNFSEGSVKQIINFFEQNEDLLKEHSYTLKIDNSIPYPTMKKIDMLFWIEGYKKSKKEEQV